MFIGGAVLATAFFAVSACGPSSKSGSTPVQITLDGGPAEESEARTYIDCTKGFRVDFPPAATSATEHETIDEGGMHGEMIARAGTAVSFSVTWAELPGPMILDKGEERVLREARDARLGKTGTLDDERTPPTKEGRAIEFAFHRTSGAKEQAAGGRVLLFLRGTTLFQVAALGDAHAGARADAGAFLSSFQLARCKK